MQGEYGHIDSMSVCKGIIFSCFDSFYLWGKL